MPKVFYLLVCIFAVLTTCNKPTEYPKTPNHSNYFPIYKNQIQHFEIKEITIDAPLNRYDTTVYDISIISDSVFIVGDTLIGHYSLIKNTATTSPVERLIRELISPVGAYIENQNNCRVVKCLLPIKKDVEWNSLIYCISSENNENSRIKKAHIPATIKGNFYDSTLQIIHNYDSSLIHLKTNQETWAAGFGLIYCEKTDIISNNPNLDFTIPIRQRIVTGTIFEMYSKNIDSK